MCDDLVRVCGNPVVWEYADLRWCYDIGRAGQKDSLYEDQCYANYDECISDCKYFAYWLSTDTDSSGAGSTDAASTGTRFTDAGLESSVDDAGSTDVTTAWDAAASTTIPLDGSVDASRE